MGLFQNGIQIVENYKHTKTNTINIKSLSGYDAIREQLDEIIHWCRRRSARKGSREKRERAKGIFLLT